MSEEAKFRLYVDSADLYESQEARKLLEKEKVLFEVVSLEGKVGVELLIGDPAHRENWLTGLEAIKRWLKERKNKKGQG